MTDIYLGQQKSNKGCFVVALLVAVAFAAFVFWRFTRPATTTPPATAESPDASGTTVAPASTATAPTTPASDAGADLLSAARQLKNDDQYAQARDKAEEVLTQSSNESAKKAAEQLLGEVNVGLVLSPRQMPEKVDYAVQPGDALVLLARKFGTTIDTIQIGNRLTSANIRAGDRLRIFTGKFSIKVSKSRNDLVLLMNDRFFKRYPVGTGQYGKTPTGELVIKDKIPNPPWWRSDGKQIPFGDTNNVLGTRWMSLKYADDSPLSGYGIHGTWQPETIGQQASAGCIRLLNSDVEELFTLVPEGTPVTITE